MKQIFTLVIFSLVLWSCKKGIQETHSGSLLENVKASLNDSLDGIDYLALDFSNAVLNKVDSMNLFFLRIPFKGRSIASDFVLVKTGPQGKPEGGKIIHLEEKLGELETGMVKRKNFDGSISISSLNRKTVLNSPISNGYITALHFNNYTRNAIHADDKLPEVVVVAYVDRYNVFSTWLSLGSLYYAEGSDGYYSSMDTGGSSYYNTGGSSNSNADEEGDLYVNEGKTIHIDRDSYAYNEAIDIEQFLKCFDTIADAGAQCEIGIYADIPVDNDPNKIFDFSTGSPGHTFIQVKKLSADGTKSIVQNIGFYPRSGWKTGFTNAPIEAKFVNDGMHEYNAAYTKSLTPVQFKSILSEIRYLKNSKYDIDNYNCTDWALSVFNKQGYGLEIPLYDVPGNLPSAGTSMPQGIYNKLMEMKRNQDVNADKIQIGFYKAYVTYSNGPCF